MKKFTLITLSSLLIASGLFLLLTLLTTRVSGEGALRVTANIKSNVFLNKKLIGTTPLCKCKPGETIREGDYEIKIVPLDRSVLGFTTRAKIVKGTLTAVDRTFLPGSLASAFTLTLEKTASAQPQLLVLSSPEGALVSVDSTPQGATPYFLTSLSESEHDIELKKEGFNKKTLRIKAIPQYKLIANVILGTQSEEATISSLLVSPTSTPAVTPSPATSEIMIKIKDTPTGFLRVRDEPSLGGKEIARVNPGDSFTFLEEQTGWYKIKLSDTTTGWVNSSYTEKINP